MLSALSQRLHAGIRRVVARAWPRLLIAAGVCVDLSGKPPFALTLPDLQLQPHRPWHTAALLLRDHVCPALGYDVEHITEETQVFVIAAVRLASFLSALCLRYTQCCR